MTFHDWFTENWDWGRPLHREDIEDVWEAAQKALIDELAKEVDEELAKGDSDNA